MKHLEECIATRRLCASQTPQSPSDPDPDASVVEAIGCQSENAIWLEARDDSLSWSQAETQRGNPSAQETKADAATLVSISTPLHKAAPLHKDGTLSCKQQPVASKERPPRILLAELLEGLPSAIPLPRAKGSRRHGLKKVQEAPLSSDNVDVSIRPNEDIHGQALSPRYIIYSASR